MDSSYKPVSQNTVLTGEAALKELVSSYNPSKILITPEVFAQTRKWNALSLKSLSMETRLDKLREGLLAYLDGVPVYVKPVADSSNDVFVV